MNSLVYLSLALIVIWTLSILYGGIKIHKLKKNNNKLLTKSFDESFSSGVEIGLDLANTQLDIKEYSELSDEKYRWVLVSERLPEEYSWVLVKTGCVTDNTASPGVSTLTLSKIPHMAELRKGVWYTDCFDGPLEEILDTEVIAWFDPDLLTSVIDQLTNPHESETERWAEEEVKLACE